jgi:hypothetical protein
MSKYERKEKLIFAESVLRLAEDYKIPAGDVEVKFIDGEVIKFSIGRITERDFDILEGRDKKTKSKSDIIADLMLWCTISAIVLYSCYLVASIYL